MMHFFFNVPLVSRSSSFPFLPPQVAWEPEFEAVNRPSLQFPDYYVKPFHAYPKGNLCWEVCTPLFLGQSATRYAAFTDAVFSIRLCIT